MHLQREAGVQRSYIALSELSEDILLLRFCCSFSRLFPHFYFIYYRLPTYFSSWFIFSLAPSFIRIPSRRTRFRLISLILWAFICIYIIFEEVSRCCSNAAQQPTSQVWTGLQFTLQTLEEDMLWINIIWNWEASVRFFCFVLLRSIVTNIFQSQFVHLKQNEYSFCYM